MKQFISSFNPVFTPHEMLKLGVFEGKYLNSTLDEYPKRWRVGAKLSDAPDPSVNLMGVKSRQPLSTWVINGWIHPHDPWGWFQWYCRYYCGRRTDDDERQIRRHCAFVRHSAQVVKCGDTSKRTVQRQALLQWSWDPFPDFRCRRGESVYQKAIRLSTQTAKARSKS